MSRTREYCFTRYHLLLFILLMTTINSLASSQQCNDSFCDSKPAAKREIASILMQDGSVSKRYAASNLQNMQPSWDEKQESQRFFLVLDGTPVLKQRRIQRERLKQQQSGQLTRRNSISNTHTTLSQRQLAQLNRVTTQYNRDLRERQQRTVANLKQRGIRIQRQFSKMANALVAELTPEQQNQLATDPTIKKLVPVSRVKIALEKSLDIIGVPEVWTGLAANEDKLTGSGITVAVIDTGIDYTHPDLGGCLGINCQVIGGYDFVDDDSDPIDTEGHGTHVAGIVAAKGEITGVAPDANLIALRAIADDGFGSSDDIIAAVEYAVDPDGDINTDDSADIINMSLGGYGDLDDPLIASVKEAIAQNVVVVAAAGNNFYYEDIMYSNPSNVKEAITVGASNGAEEIAYFTSKGPVDDSSGFKPDILAPGVDIRSTMPSRGYGTMSGTSMATPFVAGAVALLMQNNPELTPAMVKQKLIASGTRLQKDDVVNHTALAEGAGLINVQKALDSTLLVSEAGVYFGNIEPDEEIEVTKNFTLTNFSEQVKKITLELPESKYHTIKFTIDQETIELAPWEQKQVSVTLNVNGRDLPRYFDDPYSAISHDLKIVDEHNASEFALPLIFSNGISLLVYTNSNAGIYMSVRRIENGQPGAMVFDSIRSPIGGHQMKVRPGNYQVEVRYAPIPVQYLPHLELTQFESDRQKYVVGFETKMVEVTDNTEVFFDMNQLKLFSGFADSTQGLLNQQELTSFSWNFITDNSSSTRWSELDFKKGANPLIYFANTELQSDQDIVMQHLLKRIGKEEYFYYNRRVNKDSPVELISVDLDTLANFTFDEVNIDTLEAPRISMGIFRPRETHGAVYTLSDLSAFSGVRSSHQWNDLPFSVYLEHLDLDDDLYIPGIITKPLVFGIDNDLKTLNVTDDTEYQVPMGNIQYLGGVQFQYQSASKYDFRDLSFALLDGSRVSDKLVDPQVYFQCEDQTKLPLVTDYFWFQGNYEACADKLEIAYRSNFLPDSNTKNYALFQEQLERPFYHFVTAGVTFEMLSRGNLYHGREYTAEAMHLRFALTGIEFSQNSVFETRPTVVMKWGDNEFRLPVRALSEQSFEAALPLRDYLEGSGKPISFTITYKTAGEKVDNVFNEALWLPNNDNSNSSLLIDDPDADNLPSLYELLIGTDMDNSDTDDDGIRDGDDELPLDSTTSNDMDWDGISDTIDNDIDNDGVLNADDFAPLDSLRKFDFDGDGIANSFDLDDDNDGYEDDGDVFPFDAAESRDADDDGIGDNADLDDDNDGHVDIEDDFPFDAEYAKDLDRDGIADIIDDDWDGDGVANPIDELPRDTDNDGLRNNEDTDDDGDNVSDSVDAFPLDASESVDTDGDGIGNETDTDDDGDNVPDDVDALPLDGSESVDTDGDGIGDVADVDDDGDGVPDGADAFPLDATESVDTDNDGIGDVADTDDDGDGVTDDADAFPLDATESADTDGDLAGNNSDIDDDGDYVPDESDAFPLDAAESVDTDGDGIGNNADTDDDGDGVADEADAFPLDATESVDTDGDGIGNIADTDDDGDDVPDETDAFPLDTTEFVDTDGDGIGNFADSDDDGDNVLDSADAFPLDATESVDTDGDGVSNVADTDDDGDGVTDELDAFPLDATNSVNTDGDGIGNVADTDDDGDGVPDGADAFPLDATESLDTDGDLIGNNADTDDDGDGVADEADAFPLDATESVDTDGDGIGNIADTDDDGDDVPDETDAFPLDTTEFVDTDGDGIGNFADSDDDGDNVLDSADAFPLDATESVDTDGDGVGNVADTDDDGDGVTDELDAFPLDATNSVNTDGDGIGNVADTDDDGDGVPDGADAFPLDATESLDTDGDLIGNNADTDDDGDGVADEADAFPLDATESVDTDGDGIGNVADTDDDGDGVLDEEDSAPLDNDITPPIFSNAEAFDDLTVEATGDLTEVTLPVVTAMDGDVAVPVVVSNLGPYSLGVHTVTWTAVDSAFNEAIQTLVVNVVDTTAPEVTIENKVFEAQSSELVVDTAWIEAIDLVDGGNIDVTASLDVLSIGENIIEWTAKDQSGNTVTVEQTVTYQDTTAPAFDALPTLTLDATGTLTLVEQSDLSAVIAFDTLDGDVVAELVGLPKLRSGIHTITWRATDAAGNSSEAEQVVHVKPLVAVSSTSFVEVGGTGTIEITLSGEAPEYPVTIAYDVLGDISSEGHSLSSGTVSIEEGTSFRLPISLFNNAGIQQDQTVEVTLTDSVNAVLSDSVNHRVTATINNEAPLVKLTLIQGDEFASILQPNGEEAVLKINVFDINGSDTHQLEWSVSDSQLVDLDLDGDINTFELDLASIAAGRYVVSAKATETNTTELLSSESSVLFTVVAQTVALDATSDSDGDGISDDEEGVSDSDNDGIPDFLDNSAVSNEIPLGGESENVVKTAPGLTVTLGQTAKAAQGANADGIGISLADLENNGGENGSATEVAEETQFEPISTVMDFEITNLPKPGMRVPIVLPLGDGVSLPADAVYRKFSQALGWVTFVADADNKISSAPFTVDGECPAYDSELYQAGLNQGNTCVLLELTDGGIYDDDGEANGSVADPGMFAVQNLAPTISIVGELTVNEGESIELDASLSADPEGKGLTFDWRYVSGPNTDINAQTNILSVVATEVDTDEVLVLELVVSDGVNTTTELVNINVIDTVAIVTADAFASGTQMSGAYQTGSTVSLSASQSTDSEDNSLTYQWQQVSGPSVTLSSATSDATSFTVPEVTEATTLVFEVTVSNGKGKDTSMAIASVSVPLQIKTASNSNENNQSDNTGNDSSSGGGVFGVWLVLMLMIRLGWKFKLRR